MRTKEEGHGKGKLVLLLSVAASHWVCSAAGGTTNGQSVPSKGWLGRATLPVSKNAMLGPNCNPKCTGSHTHHKMHLNWTVIMTHKIIESFRWEKSFTIIESNLVMTVPYFPSLKGKSIIIRQLLINSTIPLNQENNSAVASVVEREAGSALAS